MSYNLPSTDTTAWTPVITGVGSAGTGTYSVQAGFYTRIGNMVFLTATITWSAHTGTGNMTITGLPFACRNQSGYNPLGVLNTISIILPATTIAIVGSLAANASTVTLQAIEDNAVNSAIQMSSAGTIQLTLNYLT